MTVYPDDSATAKGDPCDKILVAKTKDQVTASQTSSLGIILSQKALERFADTILPDSVKGVARGTVLI